MILKMWQIFSYYHDQYDTIHDNNVDYYSVHDNRVDYYSVHDNCVDNHYAHYYYRNN